MDLNIKNSNNNQPKGGSMKDIIPTGRRTDDSLSTFPLSIIARDLVVAIVFKPKMINTTNTLTPILFAYKLYSAR